MLEIGHSNLIVLSEFIEFWILVLNFLFELFDIVNNVLQLFDLLFVDLREFLNLFF